MRSRRYRAAHPDKIAAANKRAHESGSHARSVARADPNVERERLQERFYRVGMSRQDGAGTVSKKEAFHPDLWWMDTEGVLHKEDWRSAEEVIERWNNNTNP